MLPFSRWRVPLLLIIYIISSFLGPSVAWRVWFQKLQNYQSISFIFLMRKKIYIFPEIFDPRYSRWRFCTSAQLFASILIWACSKPILVLFSKALATARARGGGGMWSFCHKDMTCSMADMIWQDALFLYPHSRNVSWSLFQVFSPFWFIWRDVPCLHSYVRILLGIQGCAMLPLFFTTLSVRSFLEASIAANICLVLGSFFVESWR